MPRRPLPALALLAAALLAAPFAFADFTGRAGPKPTSYALSVYEHAASAGGVYRKNVSGADSGSLAALSTATVPWIGARAQVSLSAWCSVSTATVTLTPIYLHYESDTGNYYQTTGSDVVLTADSEFTGDGTYYTTDKAYVDTDTPQVRFAVKAISTGTLYRLFAVVQ